MVRAIVYHISLKVNKNFFLLVVLKVTHTFTDKDGEFVFGPLCPNKFYEIQIWANKVKHSKICATCHHKGKCLKGVKLDCKKNECFPRDIELEETK